MSQSKPTENEKLELALKKFESIMQFRSDMYMRLATRVRVFVRVGMVVITLVAFALSILLYTLATQLQHATMTTNNIQTDLLLVGNNVSEMQKFVANMEQRMQVMEGMQKNLSGITVYTKGMVDDIQQLNSDMNKMQKRLHNIDGSLKNMTSSVNNIGRSVKQVGHDVNEMSTPAMPFNMMPSP